MNQPEWSSPEVALRVSAMKALRFRAEPNPSGLAMAKCTKASRGIHSMLESPIVDALRRKLVYAYPR